MASIVLGLNVLNPGLLTYLLISAQTETIK